MEIHFVKDTDGSVAGKGFYALRQPDGSLRPMTASMTHPNGKSAMQIESLVIDPQPAASDAGPAISRAASESLRAQAQRLNHMPDEIDKTPGQIPNFRSVPK